ncbi:MAG: 4-hydroxybenzoyl-CoA thioesterase [Nocardioides sp.]|nr:4-hydroxybenzoyl-CoA thioesterase [Nocardioides sp.]
MNNAAYFELIDTAVNAHLAEATGTDIRELPAVGLVAEVTCRYFAEMGYPRPVEIGLAVERLGRSSVTYRIGLFQGGDGRPEQPANAEGRFVHVYVDNGVDPRTGPRPTVPLPDAVRRAVEGLPLLAADDQAG